MLDQRIRSLCLTIIIAFVVGCASPGAPSGAGSAHVAHGVSAGAGAPTAEESAEAPGELAAALRRLGEDGRTFHAHTTTLANPFFEGRSPETRGGEIAAEYIEFYFRNLGLTPAFDDAGSFASRTRASSSPASFRQPFEVIGGTIVRTAKAGYESDGERIAWDRGEHFNPLGLGSDGSASGSIAFVGYSIDDGEDGYSSYGHGDDLNGRIALALRFEPMDDDGRSRWAEAGWSDHALLAPKVRAAERRGAEAVIIVNPPGADDPRADRLMRPSLGGFADQAEIPVIMLSTEAGAGLVQQADPRGRSLREMRSLADRGEIGVGDLPNAEVSIEVDLERERVDAENVAGLLPGRGALADEHVVIGAHYDHLGYGGDGSLAADAGRTIHPGADDNASGVAGLLLTAKRLKDHYAQMPDDAEARSILFIAFDAEEMGLVGSQRFLEEAGLESDRIAAMLNMDMIGRLRDDEVTVMGAGTSEAFAEIIEPIAKREGLKLKMRGAAGGRTDHAPFVRAGVPAAAFFTGVHGDYHTPKDVAWRINHRGGARVARLVADAAHTIATRDEAPAFVEVESSQREAPRMNISVRLGIRPGNYADPKRGVLVGGVSPDTAAEAGGLKAGDRIIRWGGEELPGIRAMMRRMSDHEPGDVVALVVLRDGREVELTVKLRARPGPE